MAHVNDEKKKVVKEFKKLMAEYPIIGAVNMEGLPAPQLQTMRTNLREKVVLRMTKRRLMTIALTEVAKDKPELEKLIEYLRGMPALLFTKENPFTLYKTLKKNKSKAPAKAGQTAPNDINVSAGPTPFAPGPIIGELGAFGIKTGVENGKVAIQSDTVVCKEGDVIDGKLAGLLTRLGIEPMEVGLDLVATYEDGIIYDKSILDVDEDAFIANVVQSAQWAMNLAVEAGIHTKETVEVMITKGFREAKAVALEAAVIEPEVLPELLAKAEAQNNALKSVVD